MFYADHLAYPVIAPALQRTGEAASDAILASELHDHLYFHFQDTFLSEFIDIWRCVEELINETLSDS